MMPRIPVGITTRTLVKEIPENRIPENQISQVQNSQNRNSHIFRGKVTKRSRAILFALPEFTLLA